MILNDLSENDISKIAIGAALKVHTLLGPGLLESVYEEILIYELLKVEGISVRTQVEIPILYDGKVFSKSFRADVIINNKVILELKSVQEISDLHKKQLLTYLKLSGLKLGLILNFNELRLRDGITRIVNNL